MLALYEHGPCSLCREAAIEILEDMDAVPAWLAAEARLDASPNIRKRFGG
jgi:hypothetical protein